MFAAFLDRKTKSLMETKVVQKLANDLNISVEDLASEMNLTPLYQGNGSQKKIGVECPRCGAPMGKVDPDECMFLIFKKCSDCAGE